MIFILLPLHIFASSATVSGILHAKGYSGVRAHDFSKSIPPLKAAESISEEEKWQLYEETEMLIIPLHIFDTEDRKTYANASIYLNRCYYLAQAYNISLSWWRTEDKDHRADAIKTLKDLDIKYNLAQLSRRNLTILHKLSLFYGDALSGVHLKNILSEKDYTLLKEICAVFLKN